MYVLPSHLKYTNTYTHTLHLHMYLPSHTYTHAQKHIQTHKYTHTHTNTYTYSPTHMFSYISLSSLTCISYLIIICFVLSSLSVSSIRFYYIMLLFVSNSPACLTDMVFLLTLLIIIVHKKVAPFLKVNQLIECMFRLLFLIQKDFISNWSGIVCCSDILLSKAVK